MRDDTRRSFLKNCMASAVLLGTRGTPTLLNAVQEHSDGPKSNVVVARDAELRAGGSNVESNRVLGLLDRAMQGLFGVDRPVDAWRKVLRSGEKVGLKVNTLGGRGLSSNVQLVEAICERLQQAGVPAPRIVIWDRDSEELERAGFRISTAGNKVQCFGTDRVGYEDDLVSYGNVGSRLSRILTRECDVLINLPVLKDHDVAGVSLALKNMYGVIHNPNKYHPNGCNPYIADLNMLPQIRAKMHLTICDGTTAAFEGGPGFKPQYCWQDNSLVVAQDPVALDSIGWQIIEKKRAEKKLKTLEADGRAPHYLATAADREHQLGTVDARRINVIRV